MAKNYPTSNTPHRRKVTAMLAELKNQYDLTGRVDAKAAASAVGHAAVWDILYADDWLQSELGAYVEAKRQRQAAARRRASLAPTAEAGQRAALVQFCLDTVETTDAVSTGDRLRAAALAAELLGLRKHLPTPNEAKAEPDRAALDIEDLYREYPELAAGTAPAPAANGGTNGTRANGANGNGKG